MPSLCYENSSLCFDFLHIEYMVHPLYILFFFQYALPYHISVAYGWHGSAMPSVCYENSSLHFDCLHIKYMSYIDRIGLLTNPYEITFIYI